MGDMTALLFSLFQLQVREQALSVAILQGCIAESDPWRRSA
jgi:hypothetical protein